MNSVLRLTTEYSALSRVLDRRDMASVLAASIAHAPAILRRGKLTVLDAAMSRSLTIHFDGTRIVLPLANVDSLLANRKDNPTFGNVREMFARNCYLRRLKLKKPVLYRPARKIRQRSGCDFPVCVLHRRTCGLNRGFNGP